MAPAVFNTASFLGQQSEAPAVAGAEEEGREGADAAAAAADDDKLFCVTSHVVWRTSELMARWTASRASLLRHWQRRSGGLRVLELGCGVGLAGLVCAKVCAAVRPPMTGASTGTRERAECARRWC